MGLFFPPFVSLQTVSKDTCVVKVNKQPGNLNVTRTVFLSPGDEKFVFIKEQKALSLQVGTKLQLYNIFHVA